MAINNDVDICELIKQAEMIGAKNINVTGDIAAVLYGENRRIFEKKSGEWVEVPFIGEVEFTANQ